MKKSNGNYEQQQNLAPFSISHFNWNDEFLINWKTCYRIQVSDQKKKWERRING